jgi:cysteine synthase
MARVFSDITQTVGGTPLVRLNKVTKEVGAEILLKCEFFNPLGFVKDRIGVAMVEAACGWPVGSTESASRLAATTRLSKHALKQRKAGCQCVAVEPQDSPVLSGGKSGPHKIQGIGPGSVPDILNTQILDDVIRVSNDDAIAVARRLATEEGILCGISTGANVWAALQYAKRDTNKGKLIVTFPPSKGERYLSTPLAAVARAEVG